MVTMLSQSLITPSIEASSALNKLTICSVSFVGNDEHLDSTFGFVRCQRPTHPLPLAVAPLEIQIDGFQNAISRS